MKILILLIVGLIAFAENVHAEGNCPPGSYPIGGQGAVGCAPIPTGDDAQSPSQPSMRWKKTWGAIAVDPITGDMGTTVGKFSEREAKREALTLCKKHGAKTCEVMSYHNQCGVVAWPSVVGARITMQGGPSIEVASRLALSECKKKAGADCRIEYANCSEAVLVN
jgi:hypothetical protein